MKGNILIIDHQIDGLNSLSSILTKAGYEVKKAINSSTALMGLQSGLPDMILLNTSMPDMNGYEVCRQIKQDPKYKEIPVIFTSELNNCLDKVKAFAAGGIDFITKPFEMMEVLSRVENHLQIKAARTKLQYLHTELEQRVEERTTELTAAKYALEQENRERRKAITMLEDIVWNDSLTKLPNRAWLMCQLQSLLEKARQDPNYQFAVLFLNCDRFKVINDSLGYGVGDQILVQIADRITKSLPIHATISRFSGDGFVIVLEQITYIDEAEDFAKKLQATLSTPFPMESSEMFISASIGIAVGNSKVQHPEDLLRDADTAMYQAKALGKARHYVGSIPVMQKADYERSPLR